MDPGPGSPFARPHADRTARGPCLRNAVLLPLAHTANRRARRLTGYPEECAVCKRQKQPFDGTGRGDGSGPCLRRAEKYARFEPSRAVRRKKSPRRRVPRRRAAAAAWERLSVFLLSSFDSPLLCSVARSLYVFPLSLALARSLARWAVVEAAGSWDRFCCCLSRRGGQQQR